jgi:hypothetical protein
LPLTGHAPLPFLSGFLSDFMGHTPPVVAFANGQRELMPILY